MEDLVYYPMFAVAALVGLNPTAQNVNLYVHTKIIQYLIHMYDLFL